MGVALTGVSTGVYKRAMACRLVTLLAACALLLVVAHSYRLPESGPTASAAQVTVNRTASAAEWFPIKDTTARLDRTTIDRREEVKKVQYYHGSDKRFWSFFSAIFYRIHQGKIQLV